MARSPRSERKARARAKKLKVKLQRRKERDAAKAEASTLPVYLRLPNEVLIEIFKYLIPEHSACFGLSCKRFYPIHRELHGTVPLWNTKRRSSEQLVILLQGLKPPDRSYFSSVAMKWVRWNGLLETQTCSDVEREEMLRQWTVTMERLAREREAEEKRVQLRNRLRILLEVVHMAIREAQYARDSVLDSISRARIEEQPVFWDDMSWENSVAGSWGTSTEWEDQFPDVATTVPALTGPYPYETPRKPGKEDVLRKPEQIPYQKISSTRSNRESAKAEYARWTPSSALPELASILDRRAVSEKLLCCDCHVVAR